MGTLAAPVAILAQAAPSPADAEAAPPPGADAQAGPWIDLTARLGFELNPTLALVIVFLIALLCLVLFYHLGRARSVGQISRGAEPHSTPDYYGWFAVTMGLLPAIAFSVLLVVVGALTGPAIRPTEWFEPGYAAYALIWLLAPAVGGLVSLPMIAPTLRARIIVERFIYTVLFSAALVSILTTLGVFLSVLWESVAFFEKVPAWEFFGGTEWKPGGAFKESVGRAEADESQFGALPLFLGTLVITGVAMLVAVPIGLLSAVFLSEYAGKNVRRVGKPILEVLAGIPTVVYGFFAAVTVGPLLSNALRPAFQWINGACAAVFGEPFIDNLPPAQMALVPGVIMGVMIIPFMSSLCDDVINAVPNTLRQGSLAIGATRSETIKKVTLPAAMPGVISAFLLAISRAIGETMIVVMAAGQGTDADLSASPVEWVKYPFERLTTVTVQIVANLTGDLAYDNPQTLSAFSLGLSLLILTLILNVISAVVIRRFRKRYEQV